MSSTIDTTPAVALGHDIDGTISWLCKWAARRGLVRIIDHKGRHPVVTLTGVDTRRHMARVMFVSGKRAGIRITDIEAAWIGKHPMWPDHDATGIIPLNHKEHQ